MVFGFSTGSLALSDFRLGLNMVRGKPTAAIELSALREHELAPLVHALNDLDLTQFTYVSVHAPSRFVEMSEKHAVKLLRGVAEREWSIVLHPDAIRDWSCWLEFGSFVCIENMDKRKRIGRTAGELTEIFEKLPEASLCFDIAHARQVDPTMLEARAILRLHSHRIRQLHVSNVTSDSRHEPLAYGSSQHIGMLRN